MIDLKPILEFINALGDRWGAKAAIAFVAMILELLTAIMPQTISLLWYNLIAIQFFIAAVAVVFMITRRGQEREALKVQQDG